MGLGDFDEVDYSVLDEPEKSMVAARVPVYVTIVGESLEFENVRDIKHQEGKRIKAILEQIRSVNRVTVDYGNSENLSFKDIKWD